MPGACRYIFAALMARVQIAAATPNSVTTAQINDVDCPRDQPVYQRIACGLGHAISACCCVGGCVKRGVVVIPDASRGFLRRELVGGPWGLPSFIAE